MRALVIKLGPDLLNYLSILNGVNSSNDSYNVESWFFSELTHNGIHCKRKGETERKKWQISYVIYFDPALPIGSYLVDQHHEKKKTDLDGWSKDGYDAVFIDTERNLARFVQMTRDQLHKNFNHFYCIEVLSRLAAEASLEPFKVIEMCFVVPECDLQKFPASRRMF
ncbi:hypothetical protein L914_12315 [Phytophthora nicotianae]|uniref:Uncharacterized protein n=1 Tax=Phytophthora nicotianae TaxID=4792 RepID=W2N2K8_PHYNI|nr:hypothetical protein L914_12315 [Phytophthora nicotianae]